MVSLFTLLRKGYLYLQTASGWDASGHYFLGFRYAGVSPDGLSVMDRQRLHEPLLQIGYDKKEMFRLDRLRCVIQSVFTSFSSLHHVALYDKSKQNAYEASAI